MPRTAPSSSRPSATNAPRAGRSPDLGRSSPRRVSPSRRFPLRTYSRSSKSRAASIRSRAWWRPSCSTSRARAWPSTRSRGGPHRCRSAHARLRSSTSSGPSPSNLRPRQVLAVQPSPSHRLVLCARALLCQSRFLLDDAQHARGGPTSCTTRERWPATHPA